MIDVDELMRLAIEKCREGLQRGQSPFGCAIALGDEVIALAHNEVVASTDITAHAEIVALRQACGKLHAIFLEDAIVATTCEPCPMCMAGLHWARVAKVYYGASIADAREAGFNELTLPARDLLEQGGSSVQLIGDVLRDDCRTLFQEWLSRPERVEY